ncbi:MAG: hypothetical protein ABEI99_10425 [Halobaculum sp.]
MALLGPGVLGLLLGLLMSLVPSLLFLGLWRGLIRLRDDRLVDDVLARVEAEEGTSGTTVEPNAFLTASGGGTAGGSRVDAEAVAASLDGSGDLADANRRLVHCHECAVLRPSGDVDCPTCGAPPAE